MSAPPADDMLSRGLRLLAVLADHPTGLGVSAVARAAGLPVSSAHRLLGRLAAERYVAYDEDTRRYALGVRVLELSRGFQRSASGYSAAAAPMRQLAARTGLPAIAGILDGEDVLLVLTVQGSQHLQLRSAEGTRNPWHATSLGKALVAALPEKRREALLAKELRAATAATLTSPGPLREQLGRVRALGWAEVDEENEVGVRSVATTVPAPGADPDTGPPSGSGYDSGSGVFGADGTGRPRLAVSLGATVVLTTAEELRGHVPALLGCAEEIAARLG